MEHRERNPVLWRQRRDSPEHRLGQLPLFGDLCRARSKVGNVQTVDVLRAAELLKEPGPKSLEPVHSHAEGDPPQPCCKPSWIAQLVEIAVGADECLLRNVLSIGPVVDDAVGETVYVALVSGYEFTISFLVA